MRRSTLLVFCGLLWACMPFVFGVEGSSSPYTDPIGDIDPGISTANGTADITGMEVSRTGDDLNFKLTVNGNVSTTDWAKFMVGIATGKTDGTQSGNGWGRPINLSYDNDPFATQVLGMNHWIGTWVDGGGGAQFWTYNNGTSTWDGGGPLAAFSFTGGTTSEINMTVPLASMNLVPGDVLYFDAYSSGGGGGDSAIDALSNPNISITGWGGPYTSYATAAGGPGLNSYTVPVPEPGTVALVALATVGGSVELVRRRRRRRRLVAG
jgi:hypothetical protein